MDLPEEAWARDCLREALSGCAVEQHDDNSEASMHDLTITYPDGEVAVVESLPLRTASSWNCGS